MQISIKVFSPKAYLSIQQICTVYFNIYESYLCSYSRVESLLTYFTGDYYGPCCTETWGWKVLDRSGNSGSSQSGREILNYKFKRKSLPSLTNASEMSLYMCRMQCLCFCFALNDLRLRRLLAAFTFTYKGNKYSLFQNLFKMNRLHSHDITSS